MIESDVDLSEMMADAQNEPPPKDKLEQLIKLCEKMLATQQEYDAAAEELASIKAEINALQTEDIPTLMKELGIEDVSLEGGGKIKLKKDLTCGISEERKPLAFGWLEANGFGGLLKTKVVCEFSAGELEDAKEIAKLIATNSPDHAPAIDRTIHAQTLKAFIKEQKEKPGNQFPDEMFGVYEFNKAEYTAPLLRRSKRF